MEFVGQTADPWDVPVKQALQVMQKIWDSTSTYEYEIMSSSIIYKVCDQLGSKMILKYVSDSSMPHGLMVQCYQIC